MNVCECVNHLRRRSLRRLRRLRRGRLERLPMATGEDREEDQVAKVVAEVVLGAEEA